ncbi:MAG: DUF2961 domain-containing protein [Deltaproteobacteria bacterium]|nr:DUF2961 domain-containing protein [Deltaproteobacteria bacterium]
MRRLLATLACVLLVMSCRDSDPAAPPAADASGDAGREPVVELADEAALSELSAWRAMPEPRRDRVYRQQSSVDRGKGGGGLRIFERGNKDLNNWICAAPDAELGKGLAPHAFDQPTCAEPWVKGAVAARFTGSGTMVRFWMTTLAMRLSPADDEVLRVYVDDEREPLVEAKVSAIADGSAGEMFAPPFGAGTFRWVSWRYPVVFGSKLIVTIDQLGILDNVYHQTDVVLDATPRLRKRASARLAGRDAANAALLAPPVGTDALLDERRTIANGETVTLGIDGPATIDALTVERPERLGNVEAVVSWGGVEAMKLPLSDLFAASLSPPTGTSLPLVTTVGGDGGQATLRLPMPFAGRATIRLTNGGDPIEVAITARGTRGAVGATRLHAIREQTLAPATGDHPLVHVTGPGRWVGACAMLEGHAMSGSDISVEGLNFLEGDEKVSLDGVLALPGTGTEDYFDSAFYFLGGDRATPFAGWWGVNEDRSKTPWSGRATACRWHVLNDAIDFAAKLDADLEIGPGDPTLLDRYRTVAFVYR